MQQQLTQQVLQLQQEVRQQHQLQQQTQPQQLVQILQQQQDSQQDAQLQEIENEDCAESDMQLQLLEDDNYEAPVFPPIMYSADGVENFQTSSNSDQQNSVGEISRDSSSFEWVEEVMQALNVTNDISNAFQVNLSQVIVILTIL